MKKKPATVKHPATNDQWKAAFTSNTMRTHFNLTLSEGMIEYLCAIADGVKWDRTQHPNIHRPDNWIGYERCLIKRGLIEDRRKCLNEEEWAAFHDNYKETYNLVRLTPAGEAIVELFKVVGIFVEADAAITKKARKA